MIYITAINISEKKEIGAENMVHLQKYYLGIDIGSTTFKAVIMTDDGKVRHTTYRRTKPVESGRITCTGHCSNCGQCNLGSLGKTVTSFLEEINLTQNDIACTVVTGSQIVEDTKRFINYDFQVSEVTAHVAGARHYYPDCKAILDVGGQDSKCMIYNEKMGLWTSKMSGICAAGTGAFLDSVALKLGIPVEEMADKVNYDSDVEFSSVCAVLSATSINKFKNRMPIGDVLGGACRAQSRTIISGVGQLLFHYKGDIIFQGGVAYNRAVAYYLREITGNNIIIPEFHSVMGALGAACLAKEFLNLKSKVNLAPVEYEPTPMKSASMRANSTRREFFARRKAPVVWRNLFFPSEILTALGVAPFTLETYAALFARNEKRTKAALDVAAYKGFAGETCSFLRVLEGIQIPAFSFGVSTSQPCQQGERVFQDLARQYGASDKFYSLHTPVSIEGQNAVDQIAEILERKHILVGLDSVLSCIWNIRHEKINILISVLF